MTKLLRLTGADYTQFMQNKNNERERFKKAAWDMEPVGPARIVGPNGRIKAHVRSDPGEVSDAEPVAESEAEVSEEVAQAQVDSMKRMKNSGLINRAPSPKACQCKSWPWEERQVDERGKPKDHHPKCAWYKAWHRQKGMGIKQVPAGPTLVPTIHPQSAPKNTSTVGPRLLGTSKRAQKLREKPIKTVPEPESCQQCSGWKKPNRMAQHLHHELCPHFKAHKALYEARQIAGVKAEPVAAPSKTNPACIFDLKTGATLRHAEPEEVEEARRRLRDEGAAFVHLDETDYLVAFQDGMSLEPAPEEQDAGNTEPPGPDAEEPSEVVNSEA